MSMDDSYAPTWDMVIASIPHRHDTLCELLADLDVQISEADPYGLQVGVRIYRDNLMVPYGDKTQQLINASLASYVSCVDDDDMIAPGGVARVLEALAKWPDYVGFCIEWTRDGAPQIPVEHSLNHPDWHNGPNMLMRSIMQFNPIRRYLSLDGTWEGGNEAERRWGNGVRERGRVQNEVFIPQPPVYRYRERTNNTFLTTRDPMQGEIPPLPVYRWLTPLETPWSV